MYLKKAIQDLVPLGTGDNERLSPDNHLDDTIVSRSGFFTLSSLSESIPIGVFIILFVSIGGCTKVQVNKTDEEKEFEMVKKNKISCIKKYETTYMMGEKQNEYLREEKFFDNKGLKIKKNTFNDDGSLDCQTSFEYDNNKNLIVSKGINKENRVVFSETRDYDDNHRRKNLVYYDGANVKYKNTAKYDATGKLSDLYWYAPDGKLRSRFNYSYEGNKKVKDEEYGPTDSLMSVWEYKYDSLDNVIDATQYFHADKVMTQQTKFEYSVNNHLVKEKNFINSPSETTTTYDYEKNGLLIGKTEHNHNMQLIAKYRFAYEYFK
ncbi:MAG: hypothetical protein WCL14_01865 [Bacteroidota bacterium]